MSNLRHVVSQGEAGKMIVFTELTAVGGTAPFLDADGVLDLTGFTVTMTLEKNGRVTLANAPCTVDPDQVTNRGKCWHAWLESETTALPVGDNLGQLRAVKPGYAFVFPLASGSVESHFHVEVQRPAGA